LCKSGSEACCKSGDESVCAQLQRVPVHQRWISDDWVDCDTVGLTGSSDEIDLLYHRRCVRRTRQRRESPPLHGAFGLPARQPLHRPRV